MPRKTTNPENPISHFATIISSVKTPLGFSALCVLVFVLGTLFFSRQMSEYNQWIAIISSMGIGALVFVGTLALEAWRPGSITGRLETHATPELSSHSLDEAIRLVLEKNRRINLIRVFALTSGQIAPLLYDIIDEVRVREIRFILFRPPQGVLPDSVLDKITQGYEGVKHYLDQIRERVVKFDIRFQPFCPTEYFIIIDDTDLILGWFKNDSTSFTGFRAQKPIVLRGKGDLLREMIRLKAELFDSWFSSREGAS
jgi:hypothetical protein